MTKSSFKVFTLFPILGVIIFAIVFFLLTFLKGGTKQEIYVTMFFGAVITIIFGSELWRNAKIISIDKAAKTISFTNLFTRQTKINLLSNYDGFVDMLHSYKGGEKFREIYLIKDTKKLQNISSHYYTNFEELEDSLKPLEYLGRRQSFTLLNCVRRFLNKTNLH